MRQPAPPPTRAQAVEQQAAAVLANSLATPIGPDPIEQVLENQRLMMQHLKCLDIATAIALRNVYKTTGEFSCAAILTEFNIPLPQ